MIIVPNDLSGEAELYAEDANSHVNPVTVNIAYLICKEPS